MKQISFMLKLSFLEGDFEGTTPEEQAEAAAAELAEALNHTGLGIEAGPAGLPITSEEV